MRDEGREKGRMGRREEGGREVETLLNFCFCSCHLGVHQCSPHNSEAGRIRNTSYLGAGQICHGCHSYR